MAETINTQTTGYECVGIEKIEQTYEGLFDNKPNIITIYLTNGDTHQFKVMNGSQGVGIDRIEQRQTSTVSGGRNEFAIILTNGKEYTFSTYNGSGGSGSSGSFNQVLQQLNNLLMPSGKSYLYYNGSGFEWKSPDGSTGGGTADLSEYSWWGRRFEPESNSITGEMYGVTGIEFQSTNGETVIRKKLHLDNNGDLCFDGNFYATGGITALGSSGGTSGGSGVSLGTLLTKLNSDNPFPTDNGQVLTYDGNNFIWKIPTGSGGGSSSSSRYPFTIYNGSSDTDYITYDGSSSAYLKFKSGFSISKVGLGYEISVSGGGSGVTLSAVMSAMNDQLGKTSYGTPQFLYWDGSTYTWKNESEISGGSGSSGTTDYSLTFYKDGSAESWNGEKNFRIIFGNGLNVDWDTNHTYLTLSAVGGSSTGGSVDLSSYLTKTEASTTYAAKSHTHLASNITNFASTVKGIKVDDASHADAANKLASSVYLWGNSFNGVRNIGSSTSNKADLRYVNNIYTGDTFGLYNTVNGIDTSLLSIDNTPNISVAYGYRSNENAILSLFGNKTKIYTNGQNYHFDFVRNVFDVNSNQIHFGSETNGGKIYWDAANNAFKIEGNVYATGGITALGVSNNATTSNNVDFTFRSVTANTFNVMDSIQLSNGLKLKRNVGDFDLISTDGNINCFYLDGTDENYYLNSQGAAYFSNLSCDTFNFGGITNFQIVDINDTGFNIQFVYNGKTYKFFPSESSVTVS